MEPLGLTNARDDELVALRGTGPGGPSRRSRRIDVRRTCQARGCTTVLSAYNPGTTCWQHELPRAFISRGERRRSELRRTA
jgi:hypothetical protein